MNKENDELRKAAGKQYVLAEFPYPSGSGLHIGHAFTFTGADVFARMMRMQGYDVLFPMGWDSFGLPTENYAIKTGSNPHDVTADNTRTFKLQMDRLRFSFDWDREVDTSDPSYYRFTQWIFVKLVEAGLAHKQEMPINWCPSCKVGLANEEVLDGGCERCGTQVVRRRTNQWVVRITEYADRLLAGLESTEFPERVKAAQVNWIGRSEGALVRFPLNNGTETDDGGDVETIEVFTTRPDTLWGTTYLVVAPEHPVVARVLDHCAETDESARSVRELIQYAEAAGRKSELERTTDRAVKTGVPLGVCAVNPATNQEIPVWVSDFVLGDYGTGAVMAVPAHDSRDHEFAKTFGLPIVPVIDPPAHWDPDESAYEGLDGTIVASPPINGLSPTSAFDAAIQWLEASGVGRREVSYHLRDWVFSRQHYWGEPIPMIHCERCGWVPVPEEELPVRLPEVEHYQPTDTGESPLATIEEWVSTVCPRCGAPARRETDTMPNWAGSDWYFLRFCDPANPSRIADMDALRKWLPVDVYVGGDEHNTLHLLYSRFIYLFLHDLGVVPHDIPEPFRKRLSHGVILAEDGKRMSKSRGNVVDPDSYVDRYGADVLRVCLMFMGPFDATMKWNDRAARGVRRFLDRFARLAETVADGIGGTHPPDDSTPDDSSRREPTGPARVMNRTIAAVTRDIQGFRFNTAIARLMEAVNDLGRAPAVDLRSMEMLCILLAPFAPDAADTAWRALRSKSKAAPSSVHDQPWPKCVQDIGDRSSVTLPVQVNGVLRGTIEVTVDTEREEIESLARSAGTVDKHIGERTIQRVVFVPGRMVNFVV